MKIGVLILILTLKPMIVSQAKISNSIYAMGTLVETLADAIRFIEEYLKREIIVIEFIESHVENSLKELIKAERDRKHFWNPIYGFSSVNRLGRDFSFVKNITKKRTGYLENKYLVYPSNEDLEGAAQGIVRIQVVYRLNITLLANGTLYSNFSSNNSLFVEYVTPMTSSDCYYLSQVSLEIQGYSGQLLWLREALKKHYDQPCDICIVSEELLMWQISEAYYKLKEYKKTLEWVKRLLVKSPSRNDSDLVKFKQKLEQDISRGAGYKTKTEREKAWRQPTYKKEFGGCYRHREPKAHTIKSLRCIYDVRSMLLRYVPGKVEVLSVKPSVLMYHDAISDNEIESFKDLAKLTLRDAKVYVPDKSNSRATGKSNEKRTAKATSDLKRNAKIVQTLLRRTANVTGISVPDYDFVEIEGVNYGIGGGYIRHEDNLKGKISVGPRGDRFISFVYFMSDVYQGGALYFPLLGVKVYPKKGAALVFTILHPSGTADLASTHTVCPVIRGDRWVALGWFHEKCLNICPKWHYDGGIMTADK